MTFLIPCFVEKARSDLLFSFILISFTVQRLLYRPSALTSFEDSEFN